MGFLRTGFSVMGINIRIYIYIYNWVWVRAHGLSLPNSNNFSVVVVDYICSIFCTYVKKIFSPLLFFSLSLSLSSNNLNLFRITQKKMKKKMKKKTHTKIGPNILKKDSLGNKE